MTTPPQSPFQGTETVKLTEGRFRLPKKFISEISKVEWGSTILMACFDRQALFLRGCDYARLVSDPRALPGVLSRRGLLKLKLLFGSAEKAPIDPKQRVKIPDALRVRCGMEEADNVILIGVGIGVCIGLESRRKELLDDLEFPDDMGNQLAPG